MSRIGIAAPATPSTGDQTGVSVPNNGSITIINNGGTIVINSGQSNATPAEQSNANHYHPPALEEIPPSPRPATATARDGSQIPVVNAPLGEK